MAGDYDILRTSERVRKLQNIIDELNMCLKATKSAQTHYNREIVNGGVFGWLNMWDEIEAKLDGARVHGSNALSQLTTLMTLDSIYPYFEFAYEWRAGVGGISSVSFANATSTISFPQEGLGGNVACVPTSEVTADDLILISGSDSAANDGIKTIASVTSSTIVTVETLVNDLANASAIVRVVRRTV